MTRSTGDSGLIFFGSPPSLAMASRMAARSTTAGTPVKSCISTRAGRKVISRSDLPPFLSQAANGCDVVLRDRACRLRCAAGFPAAPSARWAGGERSPSLLLGRLQAEIVVGPGPTFRVLRVLKLLGWAAAIGVLLERAILRAGGKIGAWTGAGNRRMRPFGRCARLRRCTLKTACIVAGFAALLTVSPPALAQRNAVESWDPSAREFGRSAGEPGLPSRAAQQQPGGPQQDPGELQALGLRPVDLSQHSRLSVEPRRPRGRQPEGYCRNGQSPALGLAAGAVGHRAGTGGRRRPRRGVAHAGPRACSRSRAIPGW